MNFNVSSVYRQNNTPPSEDYACIRWYPFGNLVNGMNVVSVPFPSSFFFLVRPPLSLVPTVSKLSIFLPFSKGFQTLFLFSVLMSIFPRFETIGTLTSSVPYPVPVPTGHYLARSSIALTPLANSFYTKNFLSLSPPFRPWVLFHCPFFFLC